jgi:formylglycine-generating enzyme required for sulfatase activity
MSITEFTQKSAGLFALSKLQEWLETGDCDAPASAFDVINALGSSESKTIFDALYSRSKTLLRPVPEGKFRYQACDELKIAGSLETVKNFLIGETLVTQGEWVLVIQWAKHNGYDFQNDFARDSLMLPANCNWWTALKWCNAKSEKEGLKPCYTLSGHVFRTGMDNGYDMQAQQRHPSCDWHADGYRLPSQIEWERAARGGLEGKKYPNGDTLSDDERTSAMLRRSKVRGGTANNYGLYNMIGNVPEWCWDLYQAGDNDYSPCRVTRGGLNRRELLVHVGNPNFNQIEESKRRDCRVYNFDFILPQFTEYSEGIRLTRGCAS